MYHASRSKRLRPPARHPDRSGIGVRIIRQRIAFGSNSYGGRKAAEIAVLQRRDGGIACHLIAAMTDTGVKFHIRQRQHRREGMSLVTALAAVTTKARIDQHLPQYTRIPAQGM
ncbi:MAG: hypothetical protein ACD_54C00431G0001, partial [uncultured bacterium]